MSTGTSTPTSEDARLREAEEAELAKLANDVSAMSVAADKEPLNIVFIGHVGEFFKIRPRLLLADILSFLLVDAGKSTIGGQLL